MAASEEAIANQALYMIGEKGNLTDIDGTGELANLVEKFYDDVRDYVCSIIPWGCLWTTTALSITDATAESGWQEKHTLASTVLHVLNLNSDKAIPFERRGVTLYTNEQSGYITHTAVETDPTVYSHQLDEAITTLLAHKICVRKTGSAQLALLLYQEFLNAMIVGANRELAEGHHQQYEDMYTVVQQLKPPQILPSRSGV